MPLQLGCEDILRPQGLHSCKERTWVAIIGVAAVSCTELSQDQLSSICQGWEKGSWVPVPYC